MVKVMGSNPGYLLKKFLLYLIGVIPYLNMDVTSCDPMMFHFRFVTSFVALKKVDSKFGFHQFVVDEFGTVHICMV